MFCLLKKSGDGVGTHESKPIGTPDARGFSGDSVLTSVVTPEQLPSSSNLEDRNLLK